MRLLVMLATTNDDLAARMRAAFAEVRWELVAASSSEEALAGIHQLCPDSVVIHEVADVAAPLFVQTVRNLTDVPIIMAAGETTIERILALKNGADAVADVPDDFSELIARIEVVQQRTGRADPGPPDMTVGRLIIRPRRGLVFLDNRPVHLTKTEYLILLSLAGHVGELTTRDEIVQAVWGGRPEDYAHSIQVHVNRLRRKLGDSVRIVAQRNTGYVMFGANQIEEFRNATVHR